MNSPDVSTEDLAAFPQPGPRRDLVFRNAVVITMDSKLPEFRGDVHTSGSTIVQLGHRLRVPETACEIDLDGKVVLPGFIDSHIHAWEGQFRGLAPDADFARYSNLIHHQLAPKMSPDDVAAGQDVSIAQALNGGITTIVDNSHNSRSPEHSDAAIASLLKAGIRAVHAAGRPQDGRDGHQLPNDAVRLRDEYCSGERGLLTVRLFEATPTLPTWQFALEHDLGIVAELGSWIPDLDVLLSSRLMSPSHTYNHCVGLRPEHWSRLADAGVAVNMTPRSDLQFGFAESSPILESNRVGLQEGISGDNEVAYGLDMFTEMRMLLAMQRGLALVAKNGGEEGPAPYTPLDVLRAATVGGAVNAGLDQSVGKLSEGRKADLLILDLDAIRTRPCVSLVGAIVSFAGIENVYGVLVDGVVKKWDGRLVHIDYDRVAAAARSSFERLI